MSRIYETRKRPFVKPWTNVRYALRGFGYVAGRHNLMYVGKNGAAGIVCREI